MDGVVVNLHFAFGQQLLNIAIRESTAQVPAHCRAHCSTLTSRETKPANADSARTERARPLRRMRLSMPNDVFPLCNSALRVGPCLCGFTIYVAILAKWLTRPREPRRRYAANKQLIGE